MALDEPKETDRSVDVKGLRFVYDQNDEGFMQDSVIDFQESYLGKGFVIRGASSGYC
jgi:Fe-S cluster assembly iron-binding protein IscA